MIQSMTVYGKSVANLQGKKIHVEIKSLNSKALDLSTRIAPLYREKEMEIRQLIAKELERGKVDFSLWIEKNEAALATPINRAVVTNYIQQIQSICEELSIEDPEEHLIPTVLRLPDAMTSVEIEELSDEEWVVVRKAIDEAIANLVAFRKQEGEALAKKFNEKVDNIEALLHSIEPYETSRVEKIRERIVSNLEKITSVDYDKNRLEQEMIYYIEKLDISEEKQRLTNHLNYFRETMRDGHGQGKKLGFIAQEMGREINTTGSKSNLAEMQNIVVKMKDELEQIKEQVLNVL
ncbi:MAG: YicC family protein [Bacteroidaceae bacterium]|nr:YicC family protein [Bacteroidaceae bacterium]